MINISTFFIPIRAVVGDEKPVILEIHIKSDSDFSGCLEIITPLLLGFDRLCYQHAIRKKIELKKGEKKILRFEIYHKDRIKEGLYPIKIKIYNMKIRKETETYLRVIKRK